MSEIEIATMIVLYSIAYKYIPTNFLLKVFF